MKRNQLLFSSLTSVALILLLSFSSIPPPGRTGAPDEATCQGVGCHGINPLLDGDLIIGGFPAAAISGQSFAINVTLNATTGSPVRGGLQMTILGGENPTINNPGGNLFNVGTLSNPGNNSRINISNGRTYFEHVSAPQFGGSNLLTFTCNWDTPTTFETDTIVVYAAAVLANGDGTPNGDRVLLNQFKMFVPQATDNDMDGFNSDIDCDDNDPNINPGQMEIINNDVDEDCDGIAQIIDEDMDGFNSDEDCDDQNLTINPNAREIPNNDIDEDCDGIALIIDNDMDGFNSDEDCDDENPNANPGQVEIPNNDVDENCDGTIEVIDIDMDGFNSDEDCDDNDPSINPGASDNSMNGIDENCDGVDGSTAIIVSGTVVNILGNPVPGVVFLNNITGNQEASTGSDGKFTVQTDIPGTIFILSKSGASSQGVSSTDIVLIKRHILAISEFQNELQIKAADVNDSNSVSATDLNLIKNVILEVLPDFGGRPSWNFDIPNITLTESRDDIIITAYKLGDVNGSANQ